MRKRWERETEREKYETNAKSGKGDVKRLGERESEIKGEGTRAGGRKRVGERGSERGRKGAGERGRERERQEEPESEPEWKAIKNEPVP